MNSDLDTNGGDSDSSGRDDGECEETTILEFPLSATNAPVSVEEGCMLTDLEDSEYKKRECTPVKQRLVMELITLDFNSFCKFDFDRNNQSILFKNDAVVL